MVPTPEARRHNTAFDLFNCLGYTRGKYLVSSFSHKDIVFDANSDSSITRIDSFQILRDIEPRLDCQNHPWRKLSPFIGYLVRAGVVHVHPQPVTRAVHVELLERAFLDELVNIAFK